MAVQNENKIEPSQSTTMIGSAKFWKLGLLWSPDFFCSTSLPLACTRWVRSTIKLMHCPHTKQHTAVDKSLRHQENLGNAENRTRVGWVRSANATSVLRRPPWSPDFVIFYSTQVFWHAGALVQTFKVWFGLRSKLSKSEWSRNKIPCCAIISLGNDLTDDDSLTRTALRSVVFSSPGANQTKTCRCPTQCRL